MFIEETACRHRRAEEDLGHPGSDALGWSGCAIRAIANGHVVILENVPPKLLDPLHSEGEIVGVVSCACLCLFLECTTHQEEVYCQVCSLVFRAFLKTDPL